MNYRKSSEERKKNEWAKDEIKCEISEGIKTRLNGT